MFSPASFSTLIRSVCCLTRVLVPSLAVLQGPSPLLNKTLGSKNTSSIIKHLYWAVLCHISSLQLLSLTKHSSAIVSSASSLQSRQSSSEVIVSLP